MICRAAINLVVCALTLVLVVSVAMPSREATGQEEATGASIQTLAGESGSSPRWGSGWLDLATITDFAAGDLLRLRIGGTASKVLVRLLPEGKFPDSSVGILGGPVTVPENRIVEVVLDKDRKGIIQISVHGGPNPWGKFPLGGGNGLATIDSAEIQRVSVPVESEGTSGPQDSTMTSGQILAGESGSSPRWGGGWLDLATITDFAAGDLLRLRIGGTASKVLVRLLPEGKFPDSSVGILGGPVTVPENRIVEVVLDKDRKGIIQISAHGGPNP